MIRIETIRSDIFESDRDIYIYTPPGFRKRTVRDYPVLYLQDGQNLFRHTGTWHMRWNADDTTSRLIRRGRIENLIIVGIANSESRDDEYTPTVDAGEGSGGYADHYLSFLVEEVKPYIDERYPVRPFREDTGIGGSSLGGLLALYGAMTYPQYFSKVACLSPSLWWDNHVMLQWARDWEVDANYFKIWLDMGYYENDGDDEEGESDGDEVDPIEESRALCDILCDKGFRRGRNLRYYEDASGTHDEITWGHRFGRVLRFLFGT